MGVLYLFQLTKMVLLFAVQQNINFNKIRRIIKQTSGFCFNILIGRKIFCIDVFPQLK